MTSRWLFGHLRLCFWYMSLVHMTGFDLFGIYILNMLSLNVALLGVHFDLTLWCLCYKVFFFFFGFFLDFFGFHASQLQRHSSPQLRDV